MTSWLFAADLRTPTTLESRRKAAGWGAVCAYGGTPALFCRG